MPVLGVASPAEYLARILDFHTRNVSPRIHQDVLLFDGSRDHYIPLRQLGDQICTLTNARSVTARMFIKAESAHNHCGVGNLGLALRVMLAWLDSTGGRV